MEAPSNFDFLPRDVAPTAHLAATHAEEFAHADPRASGFYSRLSLEYALRGFVEENDVFVPGRTLGKLIGAVSGVTYERGVEVQVGRKHFQSKEIARFSEVNGLGSDAVHGRSFTKGDAERCLTSLHRSLDFVGAKSEWPQAPPFDPRLIPPAPPRFVLLGRREAQRLEAALAELRRKHAATTARLGGAVESLGKVKRERADLQRKQASTAARLAETEAQWLEEVQAVHALRQQLSDALAEIAHLSDEVERLQATVDASVPRADLDALRADLERREAAYQQLLAGARLTSTRAFYQKGVLDFDGLLTITASDDRPDERDEAAAVILERLAQRHAALFPPADG